MESEVPTSQDYQNKIKELNELFSSILESYFNNELLVESSLGFPINADRYAEDNLRRMVNEYSNVSKVIKFRDFNDKIHRINTDYIKIMYSEVCKNFLSLRSQYNRYLKQIKNSTTLEDLNSLVFEIELLQFDPLPPELLNSLDTTLISPPSSSSSFSSDTLGSLGSQITQLGNGDLVFDHGHL